MEEKKHVNMSQNFGEKIVIFQVGGKEACRYVTNFWGKNRYFSKKFWNTFKINDKLKKIKIAHSLGII